MKTYRIQSPGEKFWTTYELRDDEHAMEVAESMVDGPERARIQHVCNNKVFELEQHGMNDPRWVCVSRNYNQPCIHKKQGVSRFGNIIDESNTEYLCKLGNFGSLVEEWIPKTEIILR